MNYFNLSEIEENLNIKFSNPEYIMIALTHSSYAKQFANEKYNERLEYLGDSVLQLVITEYLFKHYTDKTEGQLSRVRSLIVCENSLYKISNNLKLSKYIRMSKGEEITGGRERVSILGDAVEAVIAAIYLDQGFEVAKKFILKNFEDIIYKAINNQIIRDFKTYFQEYIQRNGSANITYEVTGFEGPPHRRKFFIELYLNGEHVEKGSGFSKKEAEQNAAKQALINAGEYNE